MSGDTLEAFEALYHDLEALRENRLPAIDRLSVELEAHIEAFKGLLAHKKRNNTSRKTLADGLFMNCETKERHPKLTKSRRSRIFNETRTR